MTQIYNFQFPKYGKLKHLSIWSKGKKTKEQRFLMEVVEDNEFYSKGDRFFLWIEDIGVPIAGSTQIEISDNITDENYKTNDQIKIRVYNYYKLDIDNKDVILEKNITEWLNNPSNIFPSTLSSYAHVPKSKINYEPVILTSIK
jgi:hypothetical protein